jgi:hypothetical protein
LQSAYNVGQYPVGSAALTVAEGVKALMPRSKAAAKAVENIFMKIPVRVVYHPGDLVMEQWVKHS